MVRARLHAVRTLLGSGIPMPYQRMETLRVIVDMLTNVVEASDASSAHLGLPSFVSFRLTLTSGRFEEGP